MCKEAEVGVGSCIGGDCAHRLDILRLRMAHVLPDVTGSRGGFHLALSLPPALYFESLVLSEDYSHSPYTRATGISL